MQTPKDFEKAYLEYSDKIYRFIYWQVKDGELAEDLTSDVFIKAWKSREQFIGGSLQAWLFRIARTRVIDHWRKAKSLSLEELEIEPGYDPDLAAELDANQKVQQLHKVLDTVEEPGRSVIVLRFLEGLPAVAVAQILDLTENNVRVIQYRALKVLKRKMGTSDE